MTKMGQTAKPNTAKTIRISIVVVAAESGAGQGDTQDYGGGAYGRGDQCHKYVFFRVLYVLTTTFYCF
jgi:hypothetical protein